MADALPRALAAAVGLALLLVTADGLHQLTVPEQERGHVVRVGLQLVVLALAWLLVDSPVEGPVLWVWRRSHGLTAADVVSVAPLLVAGLLALQRLRR